jgi:hypothetical protein
VPLSVHLFFGARLGGVLPVWDAEDPEFGA